MPRSNNGAPATNAAFAEVNANPPKILASTARKYGPDRARKQRTAIALSKARKAGASLPSPKMRSGSGRAY